MIPQIFSQHHISAKKPTETEWFRVYGSNIDELKKAVDKIDLDGNLLITNDPYEGVRVINGKLSLPNALGLGLKLKNKVHNLL